MSYEELSFLQPFLKLVEAKASYDRRGYAVIPSVFTSLDCAIMKEEAYDLLTSFPDRVQSRGGRPALFFWPKDVSKVFHEYTYHPFMKEIVRYFLGDGVRQLNNQIYYREAGDGDEFAFHQDLTFRTPAHEYRDIENGYLQTIIAIDPIREDNGAIEFIPESHKLGNLNIIPRDDSETGLRWFKRGILQGDKVEAEPGDVIVWHVLTVHGSEKNVSADPRMTFMSGFAKEHCILNKVRFPKYDTK